MNTPSPSISSIPAVIGAALDERERVPGTASGNLEFANIGAEMVQHTSQLNSNHETEPVDPKVRIRASKPDPLHGLTGHAYIEARNLNRPVQRVQTSAHTELAMNSQVRK